MNGWIDGIFFFLSEFYKILQIRRDADFASSICGFVFSPHLDLFILCLVQYLLCFELDVRRSEKTESARANPVSLSLSLPLPLSQPLCSYPTPALLLLLLSKLIIHLLRDFLPALQTRIQKAKKGREDG